MNILMIGFNVQTDIFPLAFSYLKAYVSKFYSDINFIQEDFSFGTRSSYDLNANLEFKVMSYIMSEQPDVVCFSTYIWNVDMIKHISVALKKMMDITIITVTLIHG